MVNEGYFWHLGVGLILLAILIVFTFYCIVKMQGTIKFVFLLVNVILLVVLWCIFYDPIVTSFILVMVAGGFIMYTMSD